MDELVHSFLQPAPRSSLPQEPYNFLLIGPFRSRLSSLAMTFALNHVAPADPTGGPGSNEVVVLSKKGSLDSCPPVLPRGMSATQPELAQIKLRHLQSSVELRQYASCLHLLPVPPAAVIVVGISDFFTRANEDRRASESMLAKTLALLVSGVDTIRNMTGSPCPLVVTDELPAPTSHNPAEEPHSMAKSLYILKRWLPIVLEVTEDRGLHGTTYALGVHPLSAAALQLPEAASKFRASFWHSSQVLELV